MSKYVSDSVYPAEGTATLINPEPNEPYSNLEQIRFSSEFVLHNNSPINPFKQHEKFPQKFIILFKQPLNVMQYSKNLL